jgi:hypothetical protein
MGRRTKSEGPLVVRMSGWASGSQSSRACGSPVHDSPTLLSVRRTQFDNAATELLDDLGADPHIGDSRPICLHA